MTTFERAQFRDITRHHSATDGNANGAGASSPQNSESLGDMKNGAGPTYSQNSGSSGETPSATRNGAGRTNPQNEPVHAPGTGSCHSHPPIEPAGSGLAASRAPATGGAVNTASTKKSGMASVIIEEIGFEGMP
ncbi:hypothetical protein AB0M22_03620 [Nocardia sp. NPDC051756]|uniref:hypothetical protein n=1 Tax=Nocardia sp. NPDC051756 TaxID=3154751 RepID=UPI0034406D4D